MLVLSGVLTHVDNKTNETRGVFITFYFSSFVRQSGKQFIFSDVAGLTLYSRVCSAISCFL